MEELQGSKCAKQICRLGRWPSGEGAKKRAAKGLFCFVFVFCGHDFKGAPKGRVHDFEILVGFTAGQSKQTPGEPVSDAFVP